MMWRQGKNRSWAAAGLAAMVTVMWAAPTAPAEEGSQPARSLKLVPADAAFYSSMLRNREQIEAILNSKAWAKLNELPSVKAAREWIQSEIKKDNPVFQFYQQPENRQLLDLLAEAGSDEVFIYGGDGWVSFLDLASRMTGAMQYGPLMARLGGQAQGKNPAMLPISLMLQALEENMELLRVPELVIGGRIGSVDRVTPQLDRLEALLKQLSQQAPFLEGRVRRVQVGGGDFVTLNLDGGQVPWDKIPFEQLGVEEGQGEKVIARLKKMKLVISVGVREGFLLVAIGPSTECVERLGREQPLAGRPELKPLAKFADRRLTSVNYTSKALIEKVSTSKKDIDNMAKWLKDMAQAAGLPRDGQQKAQKDIGDLAADLKRYTPEVGASMSFSFLNGRGQESYSYDWTEYPNSECSKPLSILEHVGGSPILAIAGRTRYDPDSYRLLVKWIKVANGYVEEYVLPKAPEGIQDQYERWTKVLYPILRRLDETTSKKLLPSLADGQAAFVLDAKLKSRRWVRAMPESRQRLPMLEPALVVGVSNAGLLRQAFGEYREIGNDLIAEIHKLIPFVPEFEIPEPDTDKVSSGTLYSYPIPFPESWGVDSQIAPCAGLSDHVLAVAISHSHAERLMSSSPIKLDGGPLADLQKPLASAVYFNWAELVDGVAPWFEWGANAFWDETGQQIQSSKSRFVPVKDRRDLMRQVHTVLEILKTFRGYTSATYLEDGIWVTHSETQFADLEN